MAPLFCFGRRRWNDPLRIELDGSPHLQQEEEDGQRTEYLVSRGYRVLRFWNHDVMNDLDAVAAVILDALRLG